MVDLAKVIIKTLGNPKVFDQAFNVAVPELVSYRRMIEVFEVISGKKIHKGLPLPFPLDRHLICSGARIQNILGFEYTPFVTGMRRAYEYYWLVKRYRSSGG